jgi:hypothetical protein
MDMPGVNYSPHGVWRLAPKPEWEDDVGRFLKVERGLAAKL